MGQPRIGIERYYPTFSQRAIQLPLGFPPVEHDPRIPDVRRITARGESAIALVVAYNALYNAKEEWQKEKSAQINLGFIIKQVGKTEPFNPREEWDFDAGVVVEVTGRNAQDRISRFYALYVEAFNSERVGPDLERFLEESNLTTDAAWQANRFRRNLLEIRAKQLFFPIGGGL